MNAESRFAARTPDPSRRREHFEAGRSSGTANRELAIAFSNRSLNNVSSAGSARVRFSARLIQVGRLLNKVTFWCTRQCRGISPACELKACSLGAEGGAPASLVSLSRREGGGGGVDSCLAHDVLVKGSIRARPACAPRIEAAVKDGSGTRNSLDSGPPEPKRDARCGESSPSCGFEQGSGRGARTATARSTLAAKPGSTRRARQERAREHRRRCRAEPREVLSRAEKASGGAAERRLRRSRPPSS